MKTLDFPVKGYTFSKNKLHFILENLEMLINAFTKDFGNTSQFELTLDLKYLPRPTTERIK